MYPLTERAEEILERLWILTREEGREAPLDLIQEEDELRVLKQLEMVRQDNGCAHLTETGEDAAQKCVRRHRLAERLLADILDTAEEDLHSASCKFEHGLYPGLEEKVCTMLGHPRKCPHGKEIPLGDCCRRMEREAGQLIAPLTELDTGDEAVIAYLHSDEQDDLRKLMAMGALPGVRVTVKQRFPSYLLQMEQSQFAVDKELAGQVYVRRIDEESLK